jgi:hypothetical protein
MKRITLILLNICIVKGLTYAQNLNSPYSVYGIGTRNDQYHDRSMGFANAANGLFSSAQQVYLKNPASIAGLSRSNLYANLSLEATKVTYVGSNISETDNSGKDFAVKNLSFFVKLNDHWASGLGFQPYTTTNYQFSGTKQVEGSNATYNSIYDGDGGIHDIYWQNAFSVGKHFAFGVKSSFLFGSLNTHEIIEKDGIEITSSTIDYYNRFKLEYGALYRGKIGDQWVLSLGGKFGAKTSLRRESSFKVEQDATTIIDESITTRGRFELPKTYGAGIALEHKGKRVYSIDYDTEQWTALKYRGNGWSYRDMEKISIGFQQKNQAMAWGQAFEKSTFQAGVYSGNGYLSINNQRIKEMGITIGYGKMLSSSVYGFVSLDAGKRGKNEGNLIKENYVRLKFSFSLREYLFSKGRLYD